MIFVEGTADSPLAATRRYEFRRDDADTRITVPVAFRGTWDDHGLVERPEQELFVSRLVASLGVRCAPSRSSGEWRFNEAGDLDTVWNALTAQLREPAATPPSASVNRDVSVAQAGAVSHDLTAAYLELVSRIVGLTGDPFVSTSSTIDTSTPVTMRKELWKRGEILVNVDATAIESGYGIHGEAVFFSIVGKVSDGRNASASARIDMRSGGWVSASAAGVLDGQSLVDALMECIFEQVKAS